MLHRLFGSQARAKLLKIFFTNPEERHYIRQLSRDLELQVNSVRRELKNLEELGLLTSQLDKNSKIEKGEKKYYQVDKNFILFSELLSLMTKAQVMSGQSFVHTLRKVCKPKFLLLTGIFINRPDLPTDILIVAKVDKEKVLPVIRDLERDLGRSIRFTMMSGREFIYRQEITDVFLYTILDGQRVYFGHQEDNSKE